MPKLEIFFSDDCPHCIKALPIVRNLISKAAKNWQYVEFNLKDRTSVEEANKRGIEGVPTLYIDGVETTVDYLKKRIKGV